jgi:hypothetical protein
MTFGRRETIFLQLMLRTVIELGRTPCTHRTSNRATRQLVLPILLLCWVVSMFTLGSPYSFLNHDTTSDEQMRLHPSLRCHTARPLMRGRRLACAACHCSSMLTVTTVILVHHNAHQCPFFFLPSSLPGARLIWVIFFS